MRKISITIIRWTTTKGCISSCDCFRARLLLLDEPLSALDAKVRLKLREQIRSLHRKLGITTIMVTHDQEEALCLADKMVVMNRGEIIQVGTPKEVYKIQKHLL